MYWWNPTEGNWSMIFLKHTHFSIVDSVMFMPFFWQWFYIKLNFPRTRKILVLVIIFDYSWQKPQANPDYQKLAKASSFSMIHTRLTWKHSLLKYSPSNALSVLAYFAHSGNKHQYTTSRNKTKFTGRGSLKWITVVKQGCQWSHFNKETSSSGQQPCPDQGKSLCSNIGSGDMPCSTTVIQFTTKDYSDLTTKLRTLSTKLACI